MKNAHGSKYQVKEYLGVQPPTPEALLYQLTCCSSSSLLCNVETFNLAQDYWLHPLLMEIEVTS